MFSREELLPKFTQFANLNYRLQQGWQVASNFDSAKAELGAWLLDLKGRLAWELPLLCGFSVGKELGQEIAEAFQKLETALASATPEDIESSYTPLLEILLGKLYLATALKEELPRITDIKIVNELLILTSAYTDSQIDKSPIGQRLPLLLDWIGRYETSWRTYLKLFPDQLYRVNKVLACFENMKTGAGGIYLFLEGDSEQDLTGGLKVILNALLVMAPAVETRQLTEAERAEFSADLRLERAWRGADWTNWAGTSLAPELLLFYQEKQKEIEKLLQNTLMPASIAEELSTPLGELQARLISTFDHLWHHLSLDEEVPARAVRAEALAELENCRQELLHWQEQINEASLPYQQFQDAALYSSLVAVLDGILKETTPDAYIEQLVLAVSEGKARFQEVIERAAEAYPSEGEQANSYQAKARAQAASMASRFDLPVAQGQPELVFDSSFEVVQVGAENQPSSQDNLRPEQPSETEAKNGLADTDIALQTAWEAIQGQEQALEYLQEYLETGDRLNIYQAFELFSEPFFKLAELAPQAFELSEYVNESGSPQEKLELKTSSPLLSKLDADTKLSLLSATISKSIPERWSKLASQLEGMAKAAKKQNDNPELEGLAAKLASDCRQVSTALSRGEQSYSGMRADIFKDFQRLEEIGKR